MESLYKYFSKSSVPSNNQKNDGDLGLPDPKGQGPLKELVSTKAIELANESVSSSMKARSKHGSYSVYTPDEKIFQ